MKKHLLFILLIVSGLLSFGQNFQWAKSFGGMYSDYGRFVTLDDSGNIYVMGICNGNVDFDPGPGTFYLTSNGYFLTKLDPSGNFKWATSIGGEPYSMAISKSGNIFLFGKFKGKIDFDPDATTFNMLAEGQDDIFFTKLRPTGKFLWSKRIGGKEREFPSSICLDNMENIYITGNYAGLVDFDPGIATYKLTAKFYDIYIAKFDSSGNFKWTNSYGAGSPFQSAGLSITVDLSGDIITTGIFRGKVYFDPNFSLSSKGEADGFILKLNESGKFQWVKSFNGPLNEEMSSIASDNIGNIYLTGSFEDSVDFDPGIGNYYLGANRKKDIFVSKLDSKGNFVWAKSIGGISDDIGTYIVLDNLNDVYVTGFFDDSVDFDPDKAKNYLFGENPNIFTFKLTSSGKLAWAKKSGGFTDYHYNSIGVDKNRNVYTVGSFQNSTDFNPDEATSYLSSNGETDAFLVKLGICPSPTEAIKGESKFCGPNVNANFSISPASGANGYKWIVPQGAIINSGQNTTSINVTLGTASGNITVIPTNSCDTNSITTIAIKISPLPNVGAKASPSSSICKGMSMNLAGTGASTYKWSGGVTNGMSFEIDSSLTYIVKGTDLNGCTDTASINIKIKPNPEILLQPVNQTVTIGSKAQFVVSTTNPNDKFQWLILFGTFNSSQYEGLTNDTFIINNVTLSQNGLFRCQVGEGGCHTYTNPVELTVKTGTIKSLFNQQISIFPNPATNLITIESDHILNNAPYSITDQTGRQILKGELNNKTNRIDISAMAKGFYFLQIGETNKETFKIVKQ